MKGIVAIIVGAVVAFGAWALISWAFFMHSVTVQPTEQVVLVDRPYLWGSDGVRPEPLKEGRAIIWNTTIEYPVTVIPQSINIAFDDFTSSDNIMLDFESTIQYRVTDSVKLITKFGTDWFKNNLKNQYTQIVRDQIKENSMSDMMSNVTVSGTVDKNVTKELRDLVKENDIPVEIINISLGRAKPNPEVLKQMNETAAQQQRRKTLVASTAAEEQRELEQIAKAKADNAYRNAMQMSPEQYIELERINQYSDACAKAQTCIVTSGQEKMLNLK